MTKKKTQLPPRDSWIALAPGKSLTIDAEFQKKWHQQTKEFREVRGNFLAACFEIEYQLDLLLGETLFPGLENPDAKPTDNVPLTVESGKALKELFDELILKGGTLSQISFAFKIDLFQKLASNIPALSTIVPENLANKLDKVRSIRNRFAHYPITFEPDSESQNPTLTTKLVCRDKTITLDQEFFDHYGKIFAEVMRGLEETLEKLRQNTNRV